MSELQRQLAELREEQAHSLDPVQFGFIEAMARRAQASEGLAARVIEEKTWAALDNYLGKLEAAADAAPKAAPTAHATSALSDLLASLGTASAPDQLEFDLEIPARTELKSTRLLRSSISKLSADRRVKEALADAPPESGPLNPQMLAVRSLHTMRQISPGYVNRFITYVDTLFWLDAERKRLDKS